MIYVLDACVAMKWVLPEHDTLRAVRLRNEFRKGVHELIAPDVFVPEVAHGLTKAERRGATRRGRGTEVAQHHPVSAHPLLVAPALPASHPDFLASAHCCV